MKSFLRRIIELEKNAEIVPIDFPPLPPAGASGEELERAVDEAWRQLQAHPDQGAWFAHLTRITSRLGLLSQRGSESFLDGAVQETPPATAANRNATTALGSPFVFVRDWARTFDEVQAGQPGGQVIRPFPTKPYIAQYILAWQRAGILLVPKSRRMLATWTFCALDYWLAAFRPGAKVFIASTVSTKSDALLARCKCIHDQLPERPAFPKPVMEIKNGKLGDPTRLIFPATGSMIQSVSQDPDELRQEGATLIHAEEFAHWQWQERSWTAIRPVVQGGGKIIVVSTPLAGTFFRDLVFDEGSIRSEAV